MAVRGLSMICTFCGARTENREDRFCGACGSDLGTSARAAAEPVPRPSKALTRLYRRCPKCEAVTDDNAVYCGKCGHALGTGAVISRATRPAIVEEDGSGPGPARARVYRGDMVWGRYQVECLLRRESGRSLCLARDIEGTRARLVLEALDANLAQDAAFVDRLRSRVGVVSGFFHEGVQRVFAFYRGKRFTGVVKAWIGGATLTHHLRGEVEHAAVPGPDDPGRLPLVASLVKEIGEALDALHDAGLVHGAICPDSVVLHPTTGPGDGPPRFRAVLTGLDHGHRAENDKGNAPYDAPELARDKARPAAASDRFALGALAYRMLTGQDPSWPPQSAARLAPDLAPAAASEVMAYLKHDPATRPRGAALLGVTLGRIAASRDQGRPVAEPAEPGIEPAHRPAHEQDDRRKSDPQRHDIMVAAARLHALSRGSGVLGRGLVRGQSRPLAWLSSACLRRAA